MFFKAALAFAAAFFATLSKIGDTVTLARFAGETLSENALSFSNSSPFLLGAAVLCGLAALMYKYDKN